MLLLEAPETGNEELDNVLASLIRYIQAFPPFPTWNSQTGEIRSLVDKQLLGYIYRYVHVKFADDTQGTNFGDTSTGRSFYGTHNSSDPIESDDPTEYTWVEHPGGFQPGELLYFRCVGGRGIEFEVSIPPPSDQWSLVPQTTDSIDLDNLLPLAGLPVSAIPDNSITTAKYVNESVTFAKMQNISGGTILGRAGGVAGSPTELLFTAQGYSILNAADAAAQRNLLLLGTVALWNAIDFIAGVKSTVTRCIPLACSDETTSLTTGVKLEFRIPFAFTLTKVKASVNIGQSSGSTLDVDLKIENVSVFSTRITIDNGETSSETAVVPSVLTAPSVALANDANAKVEIMAAGTGATGLKLYLIGWET